VAPRFPVSVKGVVMRGEEVALLRNERDEWELPGGKLELGERPEECVAREVGEELGLAVTTGPILDSWLYHIFAGADVLIVTYGCHAPPFEGVRSSAEHREARLVRLDELDALPMPEGYRRSIRAWAAHPGRGQPDAAWGSSPVGAAEVAVRPARLADLDALRGLFLELHTEPAAALPDVLRLPDPPEPELDDFSSVIANERCCYFAVAEDGGEVVGFVDASHHAPEHASDADRPWCRINNLAVRRDRRRRGVATRLIRAAEDWARARGHAEVRLDVVEFNAGARSLYRRLGYATLSRQMRKPLLPEP
jgi:ribosomal protein S18 acetylase RimI-like enzyme/8-oxo-dGTP pyrophosphatase MutT (NUDIX family)